MSAESLVVHVFASLPVLEIPRVHVATGWMKQSKALHQSNKQMNENENEDGIMGRYFIYLQN